MPNWRPGKGNGFLDSMKMDGWKMSFLLGFPIFRGYVKLRGGVVVPIQKVVYIKVSLLKTQGKICCCCLYKIWWFVHFLDGTISSCIKSSNVSWCVKSQVSCTIYLLFSNMFNLGSQRDQGRPSCWSCGWSPKEKGGSETWEEGWMPCRVDSEREGWAYRVGKLT